MLREEHMDLFGVENAGTYTFDQSIINAITGNIIETDPTIPLWNAKIYCTEEGVGGTSITLVLSASNELSGGALDNAETVMSKTILLADLVKGELVDIVLPKTFRFFQFTTTVSGTFTAGKIGGICEPEFN